MAAGARRGLDDAGVGMRLHQPHQRDQALAAHHAVGVEHDHVAEQASPAAAEVGHVAGLALGAAPSPAVVQLRARLAERLAQREKGLLLDAEQRRVVAVAQHEELEAVEVAGARQRLERRAQPAEHGGGRLVADRHDDRGARGRVDRRVGRDPAQRARERVPVAAAPQHPCAHHGGPEAGGDPAEQHGEQRGDRQFERRGAAVRQDVEHHLRTGQRAGDDQHQQRHAAQAQAVEVGAPLLGPGRQRSSVAPPREPRQAPPRRAGPAQRHHRAARDRQGLARSVHERCRGHRFSPRGGTM